MVIIQFKKGIKALIEVEKADLPPIGANESYQCAIYSQTLNKRFVATGPTEDAEGKLVFVWPHGVKTDEYGKNIPDPEVTNGTASMPLGRYQLELYATDKSFMTDGNQLVEVIDVNILASNSDVANS